jgi:ABC-type branched-subunit amino acid transport system ATPase component
MALLDARDVTVRFGGKAALDRTSIDVERGMITGLIGPNGAGKTTLFNVVCGLLAPQAGHVVLDGTDITSAPPHRRARLGLARTFQRLELFTSLTVRDNVRVGGDIRNRWTRGRADSGGDAERIIELTGLGAIADRPDRARDRGVRRSAAAPGGGRPGRLPGRARHDARDGRLPDHQRARLRPHHRRRSPRPGAQRPGRDRGLPRHP